jgi:hypothetical protein
MGQAQTNNLVQPEFALAMHNVAEVATKSNQINEEIGGYKINAQEIVFIFTPSEVSDYSTSYGHWKNAKKMKIKEVCLSGEFNNWNLKDALYKMTKVGDHYEIRFPADAFKTKDRYEFKFVVNGKYWAEPSSKYKNITTSIVEYPGPKNFYLEIGK